MTICIATMAQEKSGRDVIILASDRMVTLGGKRQYAWKEQTKIYFFNSSIAALAADDPDIVLSICRMTARKLAEEKGETDQNRLTVAKVAEQFAEQFRAYRRKRNERRILSPYGLDFATYIGQMQKLAPTVLQRINQELNFGEGILNATAIIAGLDETGGHIFAIEDPGDLVTCDAEGFAAVGLGREHAEAVFAESEYTQFRPWTEAAILTYLAKKRAEVAPGVGSETDMYWIKRAAQKYIEAPPLVLRSFDRIWRDQERRMRRAFTSGHEREQKSMEAIFAKSEVKKA